MSKVGKTICSAWRSPSLRNAAASYCSFVSVLVCGFLALPLAVAYLEKEAIGVWVVAYAAIGYLSWMDLGVGEATGRKIAEAVASRDQFEINRWWTATRVVLMAQGGLVIIIGLALLPLFAGFFGISGELREQSLKLWVGLVLIAGVSMTMRGVPGLLVAQNRAHLTYISWSVTGWINLGVMYIMLRLGWGVLSYLVAYAVTQASQWIFYLILVHLGQDAPRWDWAGVERARLRSLFGFSISLSVLGILDAMVMSLPAIILARLGGLAQVPVYSFTSKGPIMLVSLATRTIWAFYPGFLRLQVTGSTDELAVRHRTVSIVTFAIALFGAGGVIGFNRMLVEFLAGPPYYAGDLTNMIFAAAILVEPITHLFRCMLHLSGSMGRAVFWGGANMVFCVVLACVGFKWAGLPGLAVAFLIVPVALGTYGYCHGSVKCGFRRNQISKAVVVWGCVAVLVVALGAWLLRDLSVPDKEWILCGRRVPLPRLETLVLVGILWGGSAIAGFVGIRGHLRARGGRMEMAST